MVHRFTLAPGKVVLVDDVDLPLWKSRAWSLKGGDDRQRTIYLHREIAQPPPGMEVDHINGDRLDNRRENLRLVTHSQNEQNKPLLNPRSRTGHRNIYPTRHGKYRVEVQLNRKKIHVGHFGELSQAIEAAAAARKQWFTHAPDCSV
jgi:hypothetical protein